MLRFQGRSRTLTRMRRQHRPSPHLRHPAPRSRAWARAWALPLLLTATLLGLSAPVYGAPIEASASASVSAEAGDASHARDRAISAARRAALEQAIAGVEAPVDAGAVKQVLARAEAWTAGYRVLELRSSGADVEVRIEAEIDLPRLRKRIASPSASAGQRQAGFRWGELRSTGCPIIDEAGVSDALRAYGIVAAAGESSLSLAITCSEGGAVSHTHVRAATVEILARTEGATALELRLRSSGFAEDPGEATQIALDRAVAELADALAVEARGDLELRVEQPWPAARIGILADALRRGVIGVDLVELAGIAADGSVVLRVGGSLDAATLGRRLQESSFQGFALVGLRVDGAHALRVRMQ